MYLLGVTDDMAVNLMVATVLIVTLIPIFWLSYAQIAGAKKNLAALAARLGFPVTPNFFIPLIPRSCNKYNYSISTSEPRDVGIEGTVRGRPVRFVKYMTGSGKYAQSWSEIAVPARAGEFCFSLRPDGIAWKLAELFGDHEITVGDAEFDRRWRIKSDDPEMLKAVLLPELRKQIDQSAGRQGEFMLEYDYLRYRELGGFNNTKIVARLESMMGLMCDLAEAIEVGAGK